MFIPREKEKGDWARRHLPGFFGIFESRTKSEGGKKLISEAEVPPCDWTPQFRRGWGYIFGLYFSLHIVISSSPKTSSTSGKKKFEGNQSKIHGFSLVGGTKLVNQTTKTHKCLWPSEFLCLIQLLNDN